MTRVVIIDEAESVANAVAAAVKQGVGDAAVEVHKLTEAKLETFLNDLAAASASLAKSGKVPKAIADPDGWLDDAPIVLVDEDLEALPGKAALLSGDRLAQAIRNLTNAGPMLVVNPRPPHVPTFYLGNLPPSLDADWKLRQQDLKAPSLWGRTADSAFDPWYSPNLRHLSDTHAERIKRVAKHWEDPVLEKVMGFGAEHVPLLPSELRAAPEFDLSETSPASLAKQCCPGAIAQDPARAAPVVSTILTNWVYTTLLPGQTPLIDAPHLAMRFASQFEGVERANLCKKSRSAFSNQNAAIKKHSFESLWIDRAVWWLREVSSDDAIPEVKEPWSRSKPTTYFAEDVSDFRTVEKLESYMGIGAFSTKYIEYHPHKQAGVSYEPRRRLKVG